MARVRRDQMGGDVMERMAEIVDHVHYMIIVVGLEDDLEHADPRSSILHRHRRLMGRYQTEDGLRSLRAMRWPAIIRDYVVSEMFMAHTIRIAPDLESLDRADMRRELESMDDRVPGLKRMLTCLGNGLIPLLALSPWKTV